MTSTINYSFLIIHFNYPLVYQWGKMDSNHRSRKTADLQSAPFGHSGIAPGLLLLLKN
jgi:hypothetical protein